MNIMSIEMLLTALYLLHDLVVHLFGFFVDTPGTWLAGTPVASCARSHRLWWRNERGTTTSKGECQHGKENDIKELHNDYRCLCLIGF